MQHSQGTPVTQGSCPHCDSSDAFTVYSKIDGTQDAYCFSCGKYDPMTHKSEKAELPLTKPQLAIPKDNANHVLSTFHEFPFRDMPDRGIKSSTCEHFGVRVALSPLDGQTITSHYYPYYDKRSEKLCGIKERVVIGKQIFGHGTTSSTLLFGQHKCNSGGRTLYITEGELDACVVYQVLTTYSDRDWSPQVVSLCNGAQAAVKNVTDNWEFVNSFERVVLVLDNDEPGDSASAALCEILSGKAHTINMSEKDPNDMLLTGKGRDLYWALQKPDKYQPDGIVDAATAWERYKHSSSQRCIDYPESMPDLNAKTKGVRPASLIIVTGPTGGGKTQMMRELKHHFLKKLPKEERIADISLEEDVGDSMAGMMAIELNVRLTMPDVHVPEHRELSAFNSLFSDERMTFYDHFGGLTDESLFARLRWYAATGHTMIFLDHLSIIVSEFAAEGGERERIDTLMTRLARFVKETGVILFLVVHLRKADNSRKSFELGAIPSLDDLRGSGTLKQLSWDVIGLSRNQQHTDIYCRNTTHIHVLKCRFTGNTGPADYLHFDDKTGRMHKVPCPDGYVQKKSNFNAEF